MLHTVAGWRQSRWHPQITLLLKIRVIVSDSVNRGNCLWCQHDRWKNTICWFHLWVESFVRSAEAPCTHLQGKQFSCRVLVCTSSSIYTQRSAVWQCTTFMLELVSREDCSIYFIFPAPHSVLSVFSIFSAVSFHLHSSDLRGLKGDSVFQYRSVFTVRHITRSSPLSNL